MLSVTTVATDSFELLEYFVGVLRWVWGFLFTLTFSLRLLVVWVRLWSEKQKVQSDKTKSTI